MTDEGKLYGKPLVFHSFYLNKTMIFISKSKKQRTSKYAKIKDIAYYFLFFLDITYNI
jgi:hypothetical protein